MIKTDLKDLTRKNIAEVLKTKNHPQYAADQLFNWIYKKRIEDFSKMSNLSQRLKTDLENSFYFSKINLIKALISKDTTEKFVFKLKDNSLIESVLIPGKDNRLTLCLSTQVGCKFNCKFCVSGSKGFKRNLKTSEIINQFTFIQNYLPDKKITNIVFMGIGEPLDNLRNLIPALEILMDEKGIYFGKRKICISTSGIIPGIDELSQTNLGIRLSISLHSAINETRSEIMPVNRKYPLKELLKTCQKYSLKYKIPLTFEYTLIAGVNDSIPEAKALAKLAKKTNYKINLIAYNPSGFSSFFEPSSKNIDEFKKILDNNQIFYTFRKPMGQDIKGACGQLRAEFEK